MAHHENVHSFSAFGRSEESERHVHLGWLGSSTPRAMAEGFREAGDAIVDAATADYQHPDRWFYPAAYLYRHYLELQMKNIIREGCKCQRKDPSHNILHSHNLQMLWPEVLILVCAVWPDGDPNVLQPVSQLVREFHTIDQTGQGFRYYADKKGHWLLRNAPKIISLSRLRKAVNGAAEVLDGCLYGLIACNDSVNG